MVNIDNTKTYDSILAKFFGGTFLGGISFIDMYSIPLYANEIRKLSKNIGFQYDIKTISGGRRITI